MREKRGGRIRTDGVAEEGNKSDRFVIMAGDHIRGRLSEASRMSIPKSDSIKTP